MAGLNFTISQLDLIDICETNPSNNDKIKFFTSAHKACIRNSEKLNYSGDESRIMRLRGDTNSISFDLGTAYYSLCFICPVSQ